MTDNPQTTDPRAWLASKGTEALIDYCLDQGLVIGQMNREIVRLRATLTEITKATDIGAYWTARRAAAEALQHGE